MEKVNKPPTLEAVKALREGVRARYQAYCLLNRDRFPEFNYNTSRANYEPLRESFAEEFYVVRGLDQANNTLHIPSTNTLVRLFCEDAYVPGDKIWTTCHLYAAGSLPVAGVAGTITAKPPKASLSGKMRKLVIAGFVIGAGIIAYAVTERLSPRPSGLVMNRPSGKKVVPQALLAVGKVAHADLVWVVVRPKGSTDYYVQPPMPVEADSTWRGVIYVGGLDISNVGLTFQVRAFVNPDETLANGDVRQAWPRAELATGVVEVIRGANSE